MKTTQQKQIKHYHRTTAETRELRAKMLSMHINSPSWREAVVSMYRDELDEFVDMASTPYKVVLFERDWQAVRSDLRNLLHKPIILNASLGY